MPLDVASAYYEAMSPSLLAQQPPELGSVDTVPGADWELISQHLERRLSALRTWRFSWWSYWASIAEYILPRRYHWLVVPNVMNKGVPINNAIVDSTATWAMQICAAGLWSGMTNPARPWFRLGVPKAIKIDTEGLLWLYELQQLVYDILAGSNFYDVMSQAFQDVATFGTAPVIIYEDAEDVIRCYLPCAGEYYLAVGGRLAVDTFYREYLQTVGAMVDKFGLENCPAQVREKWAEGGGSLEVEFVVGHAVEPNFALAKRDGRGGKVRVVPGSFPFREVYWVRGLKTPRELSRRGFHEPPFMVARWSQVSNDPYGRSPGMDCLGDTKQVQVETRRKAEFLEKGVRPPMGADPELKNEPSSILPGHQTFVNTAGGKKGFWPLFEVNPSWMSPLVADIAEVNARIERCFFVDVFQAITRMEGVQPRNELELTQRDLERLQTLGPFVNLFVNEFAEPAIMRVANIVLRRKMMRPQPASLRGAPLKLECISMLKIAQRAAELGQMRQTLATAASLTEGAQAAGVLPPLRVFNLDESARVAASLSSYPSNCIFSPQEVAQHDAARAKQSQQQQMAAAAPSAVQAAQSLSQTDLGNGQSALGAILGTGAKGPSPANPS